MVRGPAALLAVYGAALAYFEIASSLPALATRDATVIASGAVGVIALAACVLVLLPARDEAAPLAALALGGGLLAGALTAAHAGPGANAAKVLAAAAAGLLLARILDAPAFAVAIPLFVAGIDVASVLAGPSAVLIREQPRAVDYLTFPLPVWGGHRAGQLGLSDMIFLAFFAGSAWRHGFRRRATAIALVAALVAVVAASVLADRALPVLPALALAFLGPNLDRLRPMFARLRAG